MDREMSYMCAVVKDAEELREVGKMLEWLSNSLLDTSRSPRDRGRSRMRSSA